MFLRFRSTKQRFIRTFVSRQHCPVQRKGGGISKGGNLGSPLWLRAEGTPAQTIGSENKPDTKKLTIKGAQRPFIFHFPFERRPQFLFFILHCYSFLPALSEASGQDRKSRPEGEFPATALLPFSFLYFPLLYYSFLYGIFPRFFREKLFRKKSL